MNNSPQEDTMKIRVTGPLLFCFVLIVALMLSSNLLAAQSVNVTTWHNDIGRSGQNTNETVLTTSNVVPATFGKLCTYPVDGQVYAQPLVVTGVNIGGQHTVVYVVTQRDNVYAFDGVNVNADGSCILLLPEKTLLLSGESPVDCNFLGGCPSGPYFGILGTPVVDPAAGILYLVAETQTGTEAPFTYYHRLHALKLTDLSEQDGGPALICSNSSLCAGINSGPFSKSHLQRPGLLWLSASQSSRQNNMVYMAFSMVDGDQNDPNGFIFGYNAANLQDSNYPLAYETTPGTQKKRGGIWQGGAGLAAGTASNGNYYIYFSTADGDFDLDSGGPDAADSFVTLTPSLQYPSGTYYFAPSDQKWRQCNDFDYGSARTLLLPDSLFTTRYAVKADKENYLWVMDRTNPGGFDVGNCNNYCSSCTNCNVCPLNQQSNHNAEPPIAFSTNHTMEPEARSTPAFWSGMVSSGDLGELYFAAPGTWVVESDEAISSIGFLQHSADLQPHRYHQVRSQVLTARLRYASLNTNLRGGSTVYTFEKTPLRKCRNPFAFRCRRNR
jgi:hypothetical protein